MNLRQNSKLIVFTLVGLLTMLTSYSQQNDQKPKLPQLGMTTTFPEGIAIPDKLETRSLHATNLRFELFAKVCSLLNVAARRCK